MPISGFRNLMLNQYLGSLNSNIEKNSIFGVHKCEERKIVHLSVMNYSGLFNKCRSS